MKLAKKTAWLPCIVLGSFLSMQADAVTNRNIAGQIDALADVPSDSIRFVVLPDRSGGPREAVFRKAVEAIHQLRPDFVVTVGDQIAGYTPELDELQQQWNAYLEDIDHLDCPFLMTPGNHDNILPEQKELWTELLGPNYYHYRVGDFLFLHLDSQDNSLGGGYLTGIGDAQLEYTEAVLDKNTDVSWTFVFLHQPIWSVLEDFRVAQDGGIGSRGRHSFDDFVDNGNWSQLEAMLRRRQHTVFAGHEHFYRYEKRNGNEYYTLATAGGGSPLNGIGDGTFDHLTLVTAETGEDPVIVNLLLDGILPHDVVTIEDGISVNALQQLIPEPLFEPIVIEPGMDARTRITMELRNPSPYPLQYELSCINRGGLRIGKNQFDGVVSPEGMEILEIPVWRSAPDPIPEDAGIRILLNYRIQLNGSARYEKSFVRDALYLAPAPGTVLGLNSQEGHEADYLMDGDFSTYWTSEGKDVRFLYTLSEARELNSLKLAFLNGDRRQFYFEILGSSNFVDWESLYEGSSSGKSEALEAFPFKKPAKVRYLYYIGHGNSFNQWNSVLEMELPALSE